MLRARFTAEMKEAMKAGEKDKLATIRMIQAALKDKDIEARGLGKEAVSDEAELEPVIASILEANPGQVEAYRGGKDGLLGFFVGQVMKETGGKANPRVVSELVKAKLEG